MFLKICVVKISAYFKKRIKTNLFVMLTETKIVSVKIYFLFLPFLGMDPRPPSVTSRLFLFFLVRERLSVDVSPQLFSGQTGILMFFKRLEVFLIFRIPILEFLWVFS